MCYFFSLFFFCHIHNFFFHPFLLFPSPPNTLLALLLWKEWSSKWRFSEFHARRVFQTAAFAIHVLITRCKMDLLLSDLFDKLNVQPHKLFFLQAVKCCAVPLLMTQAYWHGVFPTRQHWERILSYQVPMYGPTLDTLWDPKCFLHTLRTLSY